MKVTLCPADEGGCGHYRLLYPAAQLEDEIDFTIEAGLPIHRTPEHTPRVVGVGELDTDVLVLQRPLHKVLVDSIPFWRRKGITVIVDIDDDFTCLHPQHLARAILEPKRSPLDNWNHLKRACGMADLVTCSTPALARRHGGRGHAIVLPNCVPNDLTLTPRRDDAETIGWTGYTTFHPKDLTVTRGGVQAAMDDTGARFLVVGNKMGVQQDLALRDEPSEDGPYPLKAYPLGVSQFTVGIVPLLQSKFNDAKSYLKGIEFAACGVPFVASPTPEYEKLYEMGVGLLADDKSKSWRKQLRLLLQDRMLYEHMSATGREIIAADHTYERNAWRWAEVWHDAHEIARVQHVKRTLNV